VLGIAQRLPASGWGAPPPPPQSPPLRAWCQDMGEGGAVLRGVVESVEEVPVGFLTLLEALNPGMPTGAAGETGVANMWNRREISVRSHYEQSHDPHPHPYLARCTWHLSLASQQPCSVMTGWRRQLLRCVPDGAGGRACAVRAAQGTSRSAGGTSTPCIRCGWSARRATTRCCLRRRRRRRCRGRMRLARSRCATTTSWGGRRR
jgi:hypothetical protein